MTLTQTFVVAAAGIGVLTAATYLLPRNVVVERTALVQAAPADIIARAASNMGYQSFNPYASADPDLKISHFGPDHGVGSGFQFEGKDGKGQQTVSAITDTSVTYAIDLGAMGQPIQILTVLPKAGGTEVTWTMQADMGLNPIKRTFGLFMDKMIGKTLEQGLSNLNTAS